MATNDMEAAHRASSSPEVRAKAAATFKKRLAERQALKKKMIARMHSPAARKKAAVTRRRNFLAKKRAERAGKTTLLNIADLQLPKRPETKPGPQKRYSDGERLQLVAKVDSLIASGMPKLDAMKSAGIDRSAYYYWRRGRGTNGTIRGASAMKRHPLTNGHAVGMTIMIAGEPKMVTFDEARQIYAGLLAFFGK